MNLASTTNIILGLLLLAALFLSFWLFKQNQGLHLAQQGQRKQQHIFQEEQAALVKLANEARQAWSADKLLWQQTQLALQDAENRLQQRLQEAEAQLQTALLANETLAQRAHHAQKEAQRDIETANTANAAKTEFLFSMSHDLRTPLSAVLGMTDFLLETELDSQQREFAEVIKQASQSLLHIVRGLQDLSRIEAGKLELEQHEFAPIEILDACIDTLAPRALEKGLALTCTLDRALPPRLIGDCARLRQIMLNLCSNAVKFTEQGGVHIHVQFGGRTQDAIKIRLEVQDSGPGLPEQLQTKLFHTRLNYGEGIGLGLSICQHLVEMMQGRIGVDSKPNKGARFWLELTLPIVAHSPAIAHETDLQAPEAMEPWREAQQVLTELRGMRVLLIHANNLEAKAILANLRAIALETVHMQDAVAALQLLQHERDFGIALVADSLPDMAGKAVAVALRTMLPQIKLVLLADAVTLRSAVRQREYANFDAPLQMPFKFKQLFEAMLLALGISHKLLPAATPAPEPVEARQGAHLLLVEDNAINQKLCLILLKKMGYRVDLAVDGQQALLACQRHAYDLILMDCEMPLMDGFKATSEIRRLGLVQLPIIAMTANAMMGDRERCLAAGMDDYVSKPINAASLQQTILRHLPENLPQIMKTAAPMVGEGGDEGESVDLTLLTDICSGDHATIFAFLDQYLSSTDVLLDNMGDAITQQNLPQLRALNHELAGTSGNLGVRVMHMLTGVMSQACHDGDFGRAQALHSQMRTAMQAVRQFVRERE
ncbi:MAG: response regulator [Burkholderiales bacterium]|nr:response regulator [Burkholderiales bacterium]